MELIMNETGTIITAKEIMFQLKLTKIKTEFLDMLIKLAGESE